MPTSTGSIRTTKKVKCPICDLDGCLIIPHRNAVVCLRVQQGCARRRDGSEMVAKDNMGWLHRLGDDRKLPKSIAKLASAAKNRHLTQTELKAMVKRHKADLSSQRIANASKSLGVTERSLRAYQIGYDIDTACWSFPMYHWIPGKGKQLCGLRLRSPDGRRKLCVHGSQNGLFIPDNYDPRPVPMTEDPQHYMILTPEGPTDCCAALDCGFVAIGRPSNSGGIEDVVNLLKDTPEQETVVIADNDVAHYFRDGTPYWPGIEGALRLLRDLLVVHGTRRFCFPPEKKDLRQWLKDGGTAGMLATVIYKSPVVTRNWLDAADKRLATRKRLERRIADTNACATAKE